MTDLTPSFTQKPEDLVVESLRDLSLYWGKANMEYSSNHQILPETAEELRSVYSSIMLLTGEEIHLMPKTDMQLLTDVLEYVKSMRERGFYRVGIQKLRMLDKEIIKDKNKIMGVYVNLLGTKEDLDG